jgi:hypothetical protein
MHTSCTTLVINVNSMQANPIRLGPGGQSSKMRKPLGLSSPQNDKGNPVAHVLALRKSPPLERHQYP